MLEEENGFGCEEVIRRETGVSRRERSTDWTGLGWTGL